MGSVNMRTTNHFREQMREQSERIGQVPGSHPCCRLESAVDCCPGTTQAFLTSGPCCNAEVVRARQHHAWCIWHLAISLALPCHVSLVGQLKPGFFGSSGWRHGFGSRSLLESHATNPVIMNVSCTLPDAESESLPHKNSKCGSFVPLSLFNCCVQPATQL